MTKEEYKEKAIDLWMNLFKNESDSEKSMMRIFLSEYTLPELCRNFVIEQVERNMNKYGRKRISMIERRYGVSRSEIRTIYKNHIKNKKN